MRVWKTWIWPITKGVVVAIIAIALVKIAFFPDRAPDDTAVPTGAITEPVVYPELGSIVNTITVKGTVVADAPVSGKAPMSGVIQEVFVQQGAVVNSGQTIASIKQTTEREPIQNADGTVTQREPTVTWSEVTAPATGTVTSLNVISRQPVEVGFIALTVTPSQLLVSGTIPAVQQYRLQQPPAEGQVTITGGPAPFQCTDLRIGNTGTSTSTSGDTDDAAVQVPGAGAANGTATVSCRIPSDVQAYAGVEAELVIEGGRVDNVLTLPVTAVTGQAESGIVTVLETNGTRTERPVTLGLSDGTRVEITGGVTEADAVLQFVPSKPRPDDSGACEIDPYTGACLSYDGSYDDGGVSDDGGGAVDDGGSTDDGTGEVDPEATP